MEDMDELTRGLSLRCVQGMFCYRARCGPIGKFWSTRNRRGYHAKTLHRRSLPGFLTNREEPSRHVVDIRLFKRNRLISYYGNRDFSPTPSALQAFRYGPSVANFASGETPPDESAKDPNWAFDEYVIFPNMQLLLFANMYITHTMWPISVNEAVWKPEAIYRRPKPSRSASILSTARCCCATHGSKTAAHSKQPRSGWNPERSPTRYSRIRKC